MSGGEGRGTVKEDVTAADVFDERARARDRGGGEDGGEEEEEEDGTGPPLCSDAS